MRPQIRPRHNTHTRPNELSRLVDPAFEDAPTRVEQDTTTNLIDEAVVLGGDECGMNIKINGESTMYIRSTNDLSISSHELYSQATGKNSPENVKLITVSAKLNPTTVLNKFITEFGARGFSVIRQLSNEVIAFKDKTDVGEYDESDYYITNQNVFLLEDSTGNFCVEINRRPKETAIILYGEREHEEMFKAFISEVIAPLKPPLAKSEGKFHMISQSQYGFSLDEMKIDTIVDETSVGINYNDNFSAVNDTILNAINDKKRGLILLHGEPGTGKTSYIKQLIAQKKNRKLVYIPPHLTNILADPSFITFVRTDLSNHVLIIEDAERVLYARDSGKSQEGAVSNILNVTDGILGDALNMLIIATFNTDIQELDEALLRKGRLIAQYKFEKLSVDKAKSIVTEVYGEDSGITVDAPMTLAEIYNFDVVVHRPAEVEKQKFGFIPK